MLSDEDQIRAVVQTWHSATQEGDIEAVSSLMADDVVFLVPGRAPMSKSEFEMLCQVPDGGVRPKIESSFEIQEVQTSGDMAYLLSKLTIKVIPPGASQPIERSGHALTISRRVGGKWLLARDANLLSQVQRSS